MRVVLLCSSLAVLAPTLVAADATYNDVRKALFGQEFVQARVLLDGISAETSEHDQLAMLLDECELAAACDDAQEQFESVAASGSAEESDVMLDLLSAAYERCSAAQASKPRARGLIAILTSPGELPFGDPKFLKALEQAREADDAKSAQRLEYIEQVSEMSVQALVDARDALSAANEASKGYKTFVAQEGYQLVKTRCQEAKQLIQALKPYLDPLDYDQAIGEIEQRIDGMLTDVARGQSQTYLDVRDFVKASRAAEEGLLIEPSNFELLELRVKIEELWKLDIFDGE